MPKSARILANKRMQQGAQEDLRMWLFKLCCNVHCESIKWFIYFIKLYTNMRETSHQVEWTIFGVIVEFLYSYEHFQPLAVHSIVVPVS